MGRPATSAKDDTWIAYVDDEFPFDEAEETNLLNRMPSFRRQPATLDELNYLRGVRCRTTASTLARLWYLIQERLAAWRIKRTRMQTRELETQRRDIDDGIGAEDGGRGGH